MMSCNNHSPYFLKTLKVLKVLESSLTCSMCEQVMKSPTTNSFCSHIFCKHCISKCINKTCPICFVPITDKSLQDDHQFSTLISLTSSLKEMLTTECRSSGSRVEDGSNTVLEKGTLTKEKDGEYCSSDNHSEIEKPSAKGTNNIGLKREKHDLKLKDSNKTSRRKSVEKTPLGKCKRNSKGETLLHLAAIRGDQENIKELLSEGYNPNIKDNAGWTPLHEACNHGHKETVELLIQNGAIINITGWENSTPLHDAVMNNHLQVVEVLLKNGANVADRNSRGFTPLELAETRQMKKLLDDYAKNPVFTPSLSIKIEGEEKRVCIMATGLDSVQKTLLKKCAESLNFAISSEFGSDVTHLVASCNVKRHCQRTLKYLQSILTGLWIVDFAWIKKCLESKSKIEETDFEIMGAGSQSKSDGPKKARLNAEGQYPPLFDGCHFYFSGNFLPPVPSREQLAELVKIGGGRVVTREPRLESLSAELLTVPYHSCQKSSLAKCTYFIVSSNQNLSSVTDVICHVSVDWLLDSIGTFNLLDPSNSK